MLVLSDSCHSGTVDARDAAAATPAGPAASKMMPPAVAMRTYREHQAFYDKLQRDVAEGGGQGRSIRIPTPRWRRSRSATG